MSYTALYRKYRPPTFDDVRGQDHVVKTLRHQVKTGRLQHAYLFCGTRGTGKTSAAKILAKAVNCEHPIDGSPCGECESCREIASGTSMNVIEIDAASNNGVDNVREIIDEVQYRPASGKYKVYIIDEVHMMSGSAFSALLKTLEEPPEYVIFILATTEAGKLPFTILSRCQRYDFRRIDTDDIMERLRELVNREGIAARDSALRFIAASAKGSMRDALSLLDRCIAFHADEELTSEGVMKTLGETDYTVFSQLTDSLISGDAGSAVRRFGRQIAAGTEAGQFIEAYISYLEKLMIVSVSEADDACSMTEIPANQIYEWQDLASKTDTETIMRFIRVLSELLNRMRFAANPRILAEVTLIMLAEPEGDRSSDALSGRIRRLEQRLEEAADMIAGGTISVTMPPRSQDDDVRDEEMTVLPNAAPAELRQICADWKRLVAAMPEGPVRAQLKAEAVPQYNAETLENKLYIELRSTKYSEQMNRVLVDHPEYREEIERFLEKQYGKHIDVELHLKENRSAQLKTVDVDRQLEELGISFEEEDDADSLL